MTSSRRGVCGMGCGDGTSILELGFCGMARGRNAKGLGDGLGFGEWLGVLSVSIGVSE